MSVNLENRPYLYDTEDACSINRIQENIKSNNNKRQQRDDDEKPKPKQNLVTFKH